MKSAHAAAALLLVFSAPAVYAQTGNAAAADPFARLHADLNRAVTRHLAEAVHLPNARPSAADRSATGKNAAQAPEADRPALQVPLGRVVETQRKLLALGVDAARIFAEEGVPMDLIVVAAVESNFDPLALSSKGARGLWQLMPTTARRFGLRVDGREDERTDPIRSTRVAARYLRELFTRFQDWPLALAAYNAGEARVEAALERHQSRSFRELAIHRALPEETVRYVPAVLHRE